MKYSRLKKMYEQAANVSHTDQSIFIIITQRLLVFNLVLYSSVLFFKVPWSTNQMCIWSRKHFWWMSTLWQLLAAQERLLFLLCSPKRVGVIYICVLFHLRRNQRRITFRSCAKEVGIRSRANPNSEIYSNWLKFKKSW